MKSRNVIITLLLLIAVFTFVFFKIKHEPKRKLIFNRNVSKVEYSNIAQCLMECHEITANDVTYILRNGEVMTMSLDKNKQSCPSFVLRGVTQKGYSLTVFLIQCGRSTKISQCYKSNYPTSCDCEKEKPLPVSYLKANLDAIPA